MDTLDFYINNETDLGLFYFEIVDYPDVISSINVIPTERTSNWSIEISNQGNGTIAITGISLGGPLTAGAGADRSVTERQGSGTGENETAALMTVVDGVKQWDGRPKNIAGGMLIAYKDEYRATVEMETVGWW